MRAQRSKGLLLSYFKICWVGFFAGLTFHKFFSTSAMDDPPRFDIVIVGAGPVGLLLSTYLARWGYKIKHVDNRAEPTRAGRADGIQPRALDLFKNMDLKTRLLSFEPARLYEVAFWNPTPNGIQRSGTWASCPKFIDARYPFTVLLHQGLIERVFIEDLERNGTHIQRPWTVFDFKNNSKDRDYPVEVRLGRVDGEIASETVKAKYLFGGEGGKSFVRQKLGIQMHHKDPIAYVWGVMDGVVQTNFPDIRVLLHAIKLREPTHISTVKMYGTLRFWLCHGDPTRIKHGETLHPARVVLGCRF